MPRSSVFVRLHWPQAETSPLSDQETNIRIEENLVAIRGREGQPDGREAMPKASIELSEVREYALRSSSEHQDPHATIRRAAGKLKDHHVALAGASHPRLPMDSVHHHGHCPGAGSRKAVVAGKVVAWEGSRHIYRRSISLDDGTPISSSPSPLALESGLHPLAEHPSHHGEGPGEGLKEELGSENVKVVMRPKPKVKPKPKDLINRTKRFSRSLSTSSVSVSTNTDPEDFLFMAGLRSSDTSRSSGASNSDSEIIQRHRQSSGEDDSRHSDEVGAIVSKLGPHLQPTPLLQAPVLQRVTHQQGSHYHITLQQSRLLEEGQGAPQPPFPKQNQCCNHAWCINQPGGGHGEVLADIAEDVPPTTRDGLLVEQIVMQNAVRVKRTPSLRSRTGRTEPPEACSLCHSGRLTPTHKERICDYHQAIIDEELYSEFTRGVRGEGDGSAQTDDPEAMPRHTEGRPPGLRRYVGVRVLPTEMKTEGRESLRGSNVIEVDPREGRKEDMYLECHLEAREGMHVEGDHDNDDGDKREEEERSSSIPRELEEELEDQRPSKKTVTFMLPPEHWDSLISLKEREAESGYPQSGYAELDGTLMAPRSADLYRNTPSPALHGLPPDRYVRWRDPDLHEVIDFLSNPNNVVKANAAAYLQHLCYMDDPTKQKTRILGGIPPLTALLSHDLPELHRNACGALRNLSYGRQNDENKRAIKEANGIQALVRLLRKTPDNEVKELVTGILWNLSSCEDLKPSIIDEALTVIVSHVVIPCSGWDGGEVERDPNTDVWWSTVFKNASGILRNVSSAGEFARTKLRQCHGLVDSLLTVIKSAIQGSSHDNKSVENCVCVLRNLSYRCQEVEDPNYDKNVLPTQSRATASAKEGGEEGADKSGRSADPKENLCDNLGCFGGSKKKKEAGSGGQAKEGTTGPRTTTTPRTEPVRGMELLWQPEVVVQSYLALLSDCSNPETLEAAAGALQNLAACYWQPSIDVRAAVRKEKGLPILVELLRMEVDRVVCAVATALRNLAIDQRNKELIGKYAMRDLVQKLPSGNTHDSGTSDETIAAVLATLNEVIKKNAEFSRSLMEAGGVERLVNMTRHRNRYSPRVVKFASQVLFSMWGHQELREVYKKAGWKEQDFVSKSVAARSGGANSPTANNTLNRPMASQSGTRYEDRTIQRGTHLNSSGQPKPHQQHYSRGEEIHMAEMGGYSGDGGVVAPPPGAVRLYPSPPGKPGEPVYAQVNRDKKRNRQYDGPIYDTGMRADDWGAPGYGSPSPAVQHYNNNNTTNNNNHSAAVVLDSADGQAGDSWV
ncbi:adherens junction protein p120 isoform X10 [Oratosquilla oratoria]|uniref:adherens junction protein p120 isoform X10 n=1 Tax=Oratosquilla oratoria TaxID=337810 RepID=UPI003F7663CD